MRGDPLSDREKDRAAIRETLLCFGVALFLALMIWGIVR